MSLFGKLANLLNSDKKTRNGWNRLTQPQEVDEIVEKSRRIPQLVYKHSDRCGTCYFARNELEYVMERIRRKADAHVVDVVRRRPVSNYLSRKLEVRHESPQAIILDRGEAVWSASHGAVKGDAVLEVLSNLRKES